MSGTGIDGKSHAIFERHVKVIPTYLSLLYAIFVFFTIILAVVHLEPDTYETILFLFVSILLLGVFYRYVTLLRTLTLEITDDSVALSNENRQIAEIDLMKDVYIDINIVRSNDGITLTQIYLAQVDTNQVISIERADFWRQEDVNAIWTHLSPRLDQFKIGKSLEREISEGWDLIPL